MERNSVNVALKPYKEPRDNERKQVKPKQLQSAAAADFLI